MVLHAEVNAIGGFLMGGHRVGAECNATRHMNQVHSYPVPRMQERWLPLSSKPSYLPPKAHCRKRHSTTIVGVVTDVSHRVNTELECSVFPTVP